MIVPRALDLPDDVCLRHGGHSGDLGAETRGDTHRGIRSPHAGEDVAFGHHEDHDVPHRAHTLHWRPIPRVFRKRFGQGEEFVAHLLEVGHRLVLPRLRSAPWAAPAAGSTNSAPEINHKQFFVIVDSPVEEAKSQVSNVAPNRVLRRSPRA